MPVPARRLESGTILSDPSASVIAAEHSDRLARFGLEQLHAGLAAQGRRIVVVDDGQTADDLVRDMTEILTSMCARISAQDLPSDAVRAVRKVADAFAM